MLSRRGTSNLIALTQFESSAYCIGHRRLVSVAKIRFFSARTTSPETSRLDHGFPLDRPPATVSQCWPFPLPWHMVMAQLSAFIKDSVMTLSIRKLGRQGLEVSTIGLGCMGMSRSYGPADEAESIAQ